MSAYSERAKGSPLADFVAENAQVLSIAVFFLACLLLFSALTPTFLTAGNSLLNLPRQTIDWLIQRQLAIAQTFDDVLSLGFSCSTGVLFNQLRTNA